MLREGCKTPGGKDLVEIPCWSVAWKRRGHNTRRELFPWEDESPGILFRAFALVGFHAFAFLLFKDQRDT